MCDRKGGKIAKVCVTQFLNTFDPMLSIFQHSCIKMTLKSKISLNKNFIILKIHKLK